MSDCDDIAPIAMSRGLINAFAEIVHKYRPELSNHECLEIACRMVDDLVATGKIVLVSD